MYLLKKEEYKVRTRSEPEEKVLIHVTGVQNVQEIVRDNFDWRKVIRRMFGGGTSFSGDAKYANKHANKHIGNILYYSVLYDGKKIGLVVENLLDVICPRTICLF